MRGSDAYLQAVRKLLRLNTTVFGADPAQAALSCRITQDDRAYANAGRIFIGLYKGVTKNFANQTYPHLHESTSIIAAITVRTTNIPEDRIGETKISRTVDTHQSGPYDLSINEVSEQVIETISGQYLVTYEANKLLKSVEGESAYPVLTPLVYSSEDSTGPRIVGANHFRSSLPEKSGAVYQDETGLLLKLTFSGGERFTRLHPEPDDDYYANIP